jgi:hypothetical protein
LQQDQGLSGNQRLAPSILSFRDASIVYQGDRRGSNMNLTKKILTGVLAFICVVSLGSPVYAGGNSNHAASSGHAAKGGGSKGGSGKGGSKGGKSGGKGGSKDGGGKDEDGRGSSDASDTANKIIDLINSFKH